MSTLGTKRYELMGAQVDALTLDELNALVGEAVARDARWVLANHNLHSIYLIQGSADLRAFYERAEFTHVDGMSLIALARALGVPLTREHRTTYVDWVHPLMEIAALKEWRVAFVGSRPGVGERAGEVLRAAHPGLRFKAWHGYFDADPGSEDTRAVLEEVDAFRPNILMVGMGMPRQEAWIAGVRDRVHANVILPCGACMDYVAGAVPTPPRWMGRAGLEWLYRLGSDPRRLWRRYLVEPWHVLPLALRHRRAHRAR